MPLIDVTHRFTVPAPHLYSVICDMESWGEWFTMHSEFAERPPDRLQANSRYVQVIQVMGMPFTVEFTVTEFQPPLRLTLTGRGSAGMTCTFSFGVQRGGRGETTVSMKGDFSSPMLNEQLETMLVESCASQLSLSLERLAAVAESRMRHKTAT